MKSIAVFKRYTEVATPLYCDKLIRQEWLEDPKEKRVLDWFARVPDQLASLQRSIGAPEATV